LDFGLQKRVTEGKLLSALTRKGVTKAERQNIAFFGHKTQQPERGEPLD
jgi:hypothetical protein